MNRMVADGNKEEKVLVLSQSFEPATNSKAFCKN